VRAPAHGDVDRAGPQQREQALLDAGVDGQRFTPFAIDDRETAQLLRSRPAEPDAVDVDGAVDVLLDRADGERAGEAHVEDRRREGQQHEEQDDDATQDEADFTKPTFLGHGLISTETLNR
jgi:hypothetical protein